MDIDKKPIWEALHTDNEDILDISINRAYQLVKTNQWTLREFTLWVKAVNDDAHQQGFDSGSQAAEAHIEADFMEKNDER